VEHDFVRQLGAGTLRRESFVHFIVQDYHYLKYYARASGCVIMIVFIFINAIS
jgi:hydroxymethylpyrimidine/phosphomethylpyrimidine kinase